MAGVTLLCSVSVAWVMMGASVVSTETAPAIFAAMKTNDENFERVNYVIDDEVLERVFDLVRFDEHQRNVAHQFYDDYRHELIPIAGKINEAVAENGQDELDQAYDAYLEELKQRSHITRENAESFRELSRARYAAQEPYLAPARRALFEGQRPVLESLEKFLRELESLCNSDQLHDAMRIPALLQREHFLSNQDTYRDFAVPDVMLLVDQIRTEQCDLASALDALTATDVYADAADLYEQTIHRVTQRKWNRLFHVPDDDEPFVMDDDTSKRFAAEWAAMYSSTQMFFESIRIELEEQFGSDVAASWTQRYNASFFPRLFDDRWFAYVKDWIEKSEETLAENQRLGLRAFVDRYRDGLTRLRARAVRSGVRAMKQHFIPIGMREEQIKYAEAILDIGQFNQDAYSRFIALLSNQQRTEFQRYFRRDPGYNGLSPGEDRPWLPDGIVNKIRND